MISRLREAARIPRDDCRSLFALAANTLCHYLPHHTGSEEVHVRTSAIFTGNDVIINFGVILAGILVHWLNSGLPDLVTGGIVFTIGVRGAIRILRLSPCAPRESPS